MPREVRVERLLGRRVLGLNGHPVGRIEEIHARARGDACVVQEFVIGPHALFERLAMLTPRWLAWLRADVGPSYRIPWSRLDLTDPDRPRLTCPVSELAAEWVSRTAAGRAPESPGRRSRARRRRSSGARGRP